MKLLGCDPGLKGAVCFLDTQTRELIFIDNDFDDQKFLTKKCFNQLQQLPDGFIAVMENVQQMQGWSARSNQTLQRTVGALGSVLSSKVTNLVLVSPITWKHQLYLTDDKELSIAVAHLLYPEHRDIINRHDRAEALLVIDWYLNGNKDAVLE